MKRLSVLLVVFIFLFSSCDSEASKKEEIRINLSDNEITVDGVKITNDSEQAVYSANDIVFYLADQGFTYGEGTEEDAHEQSEADAHTVIHITKPGRYILSGKLSLGQIAVDLGEDAKKDPDAVVTLILDGVDITCEVAPAVIFYNVYECGSSEEETAVKDIDTSKAGANVVIADGTENNINGSYVAKIYETYELSQDGTEVVDSEKLHKYDAAFYSKRTMNVAGGKKGDGILNINAENEGLDSELHLTINGGIINITSGNDGINTNEDNVSVTTINGGTLNIICTGATEEGDGIDSNGWIVINGGTVTAQACAISGDAGIDSDKGIYINGGKVFAAGNMFDNIAGGEQTHAVFSFANPQSGGSTYTLKNSNGEIAAEFSPKNDFTYIIIADDLTPGEYTFWQNDVQLSAYSTDGFMGGTQKDNRPQMPEGERLEIQEGERPDNPPFEKPNGEIPEFPENPGNNPPPGALNGEIKSNGETSVIFKITEGANHFSRVCSVE